MAHLSTGLTSGIPVPSQPSRHVVFATSQERRTFPENVPANAIGVNGIVIFGTPEVGPGTYENEAKTNFTALNRNKIQSNIGYTLGARTAARFRKITVDNTPCPTHYQQHQTQPMRFHTDAKPFLVGVERFKSRATDYEYNPSPNTYNFDTAQNRKVAWQQSFGGAPTSMPDATLKSSIPANTNKLYTTTEEQKYHRKLAYLKLYWD